MLNLRDLITQRLYQVVPDTCFVIMPFREEYDDVFRAVVDALAALEQPIKTHRAEAFSSSSPIIDEILSDILSADYVVADLTTQNPNVLYELGLSHALKSDVILLTQTPASVPFDVTHLRLLAYEHTEAGLRSLRARLQNAVRAMRANRQLGARLDSLCQVGRACAVRIGDWIESSVGVINAAAGWPEMQANDGESHLRVLRKIQNILPAFGGGVYTLDAAGTIVSSSPVDIDGINFAHREYFQQCSTSLQPVISNSFDSADRRSSPGQRTRARRIVVVAVPRYGPEGRFVGILDAVLDVGNSLFAGIIDDALRGPHACDGLVISVIDESDIVIASSSLELLSKDLAWHPLVRRLREELGDAGPEAACRIRDDGGGASYQLGAVCRIRKTPFVVVATARV